MCVCVSVYHWKGTRKLCPHTVWKVVVLGFMQERFHSSSPGGIQSTLIKAGVGETKAGLTIEETRL